MTKKIFQLVACLLLTTSLQAKLVWENPSQEIKYEIDGPLTFLFHVKNFGTSPVSIKYVQPGCGCTSAKINKTELEPQDTATVTCVVDTNKTNSGRPNKVLVQDGEGNDHILSLTVIKDETFTIEPRSLIWSPNKAYPQTVHINFKPDSKYKITSIESLSKKFKVTEKKFGEGYLELIISPENTIPTLSATKVIFSDGKNPIPIWIKTVISNDNTPSQPKPTPETP